MEFAVENAQTLKKRSERSMRMPGSAVAGEAKGGANSSAPARPSEADAVVGGDEQGVAAAKRKRKRGHSGVRQPCLPLFSPNPACLYSGQPACHQCPVADVCRSSPVPLVGRCSPRRAQRLRSASRLRSLQAAEVEGRAYERLSCRRFPSVLDSVRMRRVTAVRQPGQGRVNPPPLSQRRRARDAAPDSSALERGSVAPP